MARSALTGYPATAMNATAAAIERRRRAALRQVMAPLNDDLDVLLQRHRRVAEEIQVHADAFAAGRRYSRPELVLRDERAARGSRTAHRPEHRAAGFPADRVREHASRRGESRDVCRDVERLQ